MGECPPASVAGVELAARPAGAGWSWLWSSGATASGISPEGVPPALRTDRSYSFSVASSGCDGLRVFRVVPGIWAWTCTRHAGHGEEGFADRGSATTRATMLG